MTNDAKLLTAAAELGRDRVLLDPTNDDIIFASEELADVAVSTRDWIARRQCDGILSAFAKGEELEDEEADVAPIVRSVASMYGLA